METRFKLITWNVEEECVFSKDFKNENEAIQMAQALGNRGCCPHEVINILRTKKTGHKWEVAVLNIDKPQNVEYISFYSKKEAIFAIKAIEEYDHTLRAKPIKIY